jgi:hypothetical protein
MMIVFTVKQSETPVSGTARCTIWGLKNLCYIGEPEIQVQTPNVLSQSVL